MDKRQDAFDDNRRYRFRIENGVLKNTYYAGGSYNPSALFAEMNYAAVPAEVTTLSRTAFSSAFHLNRIILPPTVKKIESGAFGRFCGEIVLSEGFTAAFLRDGVLYSEDGTVLLKATKEAEGKKIKVPEGILEISPHAFERIDIQAVSLPNSLEKIGANAFGDAERGCLYLTIGDRLPIKGFAVQIPAKVKSIGAGAFQSNRISQITVDGENRRFQTIEGVLFTKNGKKLIHCPTGKTDSFRIPEETEEICPAAFGGSTLSEVIVPGSFGDKLKPHCFAGSWIKKAIFENGVTALPECCLASCGKMERIVIPASVTNIAEDAFDRTAVNLNYPVNSNGNGQATIAAPAGSYAISFAKRHGLKYAEL